MLKRVAAAMLLGTCMVPGAAWAEDAGTVAAEPTGTVVSDENRSAARIFTSADFARFSPRNALDMVRQIPGFSLRGEDDQRGLGQSSANVLIDGERIASKSEGVYGRLTSISADRVVRIEIVDGASLGIAGLSGQVANVVTTPDPFSGRFDYNAGFRPKYADPLLFGGEFSISGAKESLEWTLSYNHGYGRGAAGGGTSYIADAEGKIIENRDVLVQVTGDFPQLSGRVKWTSPGGTVLNVNASYTELFQRIRDDEMRRPVDGIERFRDFDNKLRGANYELGGDVEFGLGPGRLKLIAQDTFRHRKYKQDYILDYADETPSAGSRYTSHNDSGERIARGEYSWAMLGGDWQLDAEAAFNRLNRKASLFDLDPDGEFVSVPFPTGSGGVTEDRYETILTHSRTLGEGLTLQVGAGGEYSTIAQTGSRGLTRSFWRPKGSANLAWAAGSGFDVSLKVARSVGQLSFGDFLASVQLNQDNGSAGNIELVPPQSWDADLEIKKDLGEYGSTTLRLYGRWYEDFIEIIPVPGGLEASGNIPSARLYGVDWDTTLELEKMGIAGAKIDLALDYEDTTLDDPLTGVARPFSGQRDIYAEASFRHDIPGSDIAYGFGAQYNHTQPFYRLGEVSLEYEGPIYTFAFVEHKDVLGMTLRAEVFNLTDGRAKFQRTVYDGYRDRSDVLFREYRDLSVQPIFNFSLKGDF